VSGEAARDETRVLPAYCAFFKNVLLPFQCTIEELEWDNWRIEKQSEPKKRRHVCWGRIRDVVKTC
jgi:hypothetical protein